MSSIKSYADKNAVKVIAFAVSFTQQLSTEQIDLFIKKLTEDSFYNQEFNEIQPQKEIFMTIGPDGVHQQKESIGGVICRKTSDNKILWEIVINKTGVVATCRKYSRWAPISNKFYEYITSIIKLIDKNISQITLEYLDEFEIIEDKNNWKEELFKESCEYITPYVLNTSDFWHVEQGFFSQLDGLDDKFLDNIRINYFNDTGNDTKNKINIVTQHITRFEDSKKFEIDFIKNVFQIAHTHSKNIFENIIHDDILVRFDRGNT